MYKNNDLLVCGKYYNTSDVFKINEDAQISVEEFGDQKVVVVDDFYSNPELVRYMSLNNLPPVFGIQNNIKIFAIKRFPCDLTTSLRCIVS